MAVYNKIRDSEVLNLFCLEVDLLFVALVTRMLPQA
jgi:hypothetical protein